MFAALLGLILAQLAQSGCAPFGGKSDSGVSENTAELAAAILADAIRIDTVNPPGGEKRLAEFYVDLLREHGIEAKVVDTPSPNGDSGRAAAWARVPGSGRGRPIVLLSHLDVVEAVPSEWAVDPFAGVVGGGSVVGRGALDSKGVSVVHLLTLIEISRRFAPLDRDVIFLATPEEETGGRYGSGYLARERRHLLYDAEFLLTEGGGILLGGRNPGGPDLPPIWGVSVAEKSPCWIELEARGTPGHTSAPPHDAAVPRLITALERVDRIETEVHVVPAVERMFEALAPVAPPEDRSGFQHLRLALELDPAFRSRFLADTGRAAMVRDTFTVSVLEGGLRTNMVPATARAHIDARLLPGSRCRDFVDHVREVIDDPGISAEPILSFQSTESPVDTALMAAIREVAADVDPGAPVVPRMIAGFTDAHWFRDEGIVAYGFVPRWLTNADTRGIHGPNERISLENLERGVHTLVRILERMHRQ